MLKVPVVAKNSNKLHGSRFGKTKKKKNQLVASSRIPCKSEATIEFRLNVKV